MERNADERSKECVMVEVRYQIRHFACILLGASLTLIPNALDLGVERRVEVECLGCSHKCTVLRADNCEFEVRMLLRCRTIMLDKS